MDLVHKLGSAMRGLADGAVRIAGGQFIPASCPSCRVLWMIGLGLAVALIVVYWRGPKTH